MGWTCASQKPAVPSSCGAEVIPGPVCPGSEPPILPPSKPSFKPTLTECSAKAAVPICQKVLNCSKPGLLLCIILFLFLFLVLFLVYEFTGQEPLDQDVLRDVHQDDE